MMQTHQHTITALVENESGTLNRLVSLFRRRAFSLSSLNAGDCEQAGLSRLTIVVNGDENTLRQCVRQLEKLIDVIEVDDLPREEAVQRELAFIKVTASAERRREVLDISQAMHCEVVHLGLEHMTLQMSASPSRINSLILLLEPYGVLQVVRSGLVAIRVEG